MFILLTGAQSFDKFYINMDLVEKIVICTTGNAKSALFCTSSPQPLLVTETFTDIAALMGPSQAEKDLIARMQKSNDEADARHAAWLAKHREDLKTEGERQAEDIILSADAIEARYNHSTDAYTKAMEATGWQPYDDQPETASATPYTSSASGAHASTSQTQPGRLARLAEQSRRLLRRLIGVGDSREW